MKNIEQLKKKITYRSEYRGIKEMNLLLSNFVRKYINKFNVVELKQLESLLNIDDIILFEWYLNKRSKINIPNNKVSKLLKNFKV